MTGPGPIIPFYPLRSMHDDIRQGLDEVWASVVDSGEFIGGRFVERFEVEWASYCATSTCVGVANGTDALELALRSLGVGNDDEVIVPANTFYATVEAVMAVGARPVFVDVDDLTLLMDLDAAEAAVTDRTSAVIAVHLFGQPVDLGRLRGIADSAGIALVEDCAQAHGARWAGQQVGSFGEVSCFSFYPGKNLGALGDGGAVVTSDPELDARLRSLRDHGRASDARGVHTEVGRNSRLDALQAGVLSLKLSHLDDWNAARGRLHEAYVNRLSGSDHVQLTAVAAHADAVHHLEVVRLEHRDDVQREMERRGVGTGVHYSRACPDQPGLLHLPTVDVPVARRAALHQLSLPMYPGLTEDGVDVVCSALVAAVEGWRGR